MKKQKIKKSDFYGETIFNIAAYNCRRDFFIGRRNSKRAYLSVLALTKYMDNFTKTLEKKINGI